MVSLSTVVLTIFVGGHLGVRDNLTEHHEEVICHFIFCLVGAFGAMALCY